MTEDWKARLAHFEESPVVDFFGIVSHQGAGTWKAIEDKGTIEPGELGVSVFQFDAWRVAMDAVQVTDISMTAIIPHQRWYSFLSFTQGYLRPFSIVHIKAKIARNPAGFQEALFVEWVGPATQDAELNELRRQLFEPDQEDWFPLPKLQLSTYDGSWLGSVVLPSWEGFYLESEPSFGDGRGTVFPLKIESDESDSLPVVNLGYRGTPPSAEQVAAYAYLTENEKTVQDALLQGILERYPGWQEDYSGDEEYMPDVTSQEQFRSLLMLRKVSIQRKAKEGTAYVYLSLDPNWDPEHGLAAVMHRDRVVAVGDHDSMWHVSERDAELG